MIKNRIPITLTDERQRVTGPTVSYRYDAVQYLVISGVELPEAYAVDFCNLGDETTTPIVGGADGVRIPNKYLRTGKTIIAYLIITGDDEDAVETRYEITLPVRSRPKRGELDPAEDEREEIDILVDRLNEAVVEAEEQATDAAASAASAAEDAGKAEAAVTHYPQIVDRYWYVWDAEHETWTNTGIKAEGVDGTDGVGIQSLAWNSDYTMTITMTNGTVYTSISLRGEVGATPDFSIGTVTTGAAGSQASATITGTPERPVLNLTIPRGDTGEVSQADLAEALRPLNQAINVLDGQVNDSTTGLDTKAPAIINTASGAIASFSDGANGMPVKKLVVSIEPVQAGSGDPSPDNVRPISGWTGAEIEGCGKNLIDDSKRYVAANTTVYVGTAGTAYDLALKAGTYLISADFNGEPYGMYYRKQNEDPITIWASGSNITQRTFTIEEDGVFRFWVYRGSNSGGVDPTKIIHVQLELGSTATAYEPYTGSQISVTFPSEAGTVYGGTLTINPDRTGALVVDRAYALLNDPDKWGVYRGSVVKYSYSQSFADRAYGSRTIGYCTAFPTFDRNISFCLAWLNATNQPYCGVVDTNSTITLEQIKEMASNNEIAICYDLAEPVTYTLTESEISAILTTLYGTNNIWADCGDTEVTYTADTKLYIEQLTQPTEDDMTADHAISAGTFFQLGNALYLATSQIAAGATITPGTNATKLSLADALNQLNA